MAAATPLLILALLAGLGLAVLTLLRPRWAEPADRRADHDRTMRHLAAAARHAANDHRRTP